MYQHPHFYHVTNEYLLLKKIAYFMISEFWTFGLQNLFVRTPEPFFSNLRTFGLKNLRTREPSNLRTFGLIGCNPSKRVTRGFHAWKYIPIYSQHNIYKFSFLPRTIIDWNTLSPHSVDSPSIDTFRARITKN